MNFEGSDGSRAATPERVEGINSGSGREMDTGIRGPEKGRSGSHQRAVEWITGHPRSDAIHADLRVETDPGKALALGREYAASLGRGTAENWPHRVLLAKHAIALAVRRAGQPPRGSYDNELWDTYTDAWNQRAAELSEAAIQRALDAITKLKKKDCSNAALDHRLCYIVEDDLGRFSDVDLATAVPLLVERAGFVSDEAEALTCHLLRLGNVGRRGRDAERRRAHAGARREFKHGRRERKAQGQARYPIYAINTATWRAVEDEEFEAAEIARAERQAAEAAMRSAEGNIAWARRKGGSFETSLLEVFVAGFRTADQFLSLESMVERLTQVFDHVEGIDLPSIIAKVIDAARSCRSGEEAETAFMRLLASEGIAAPNAVAAAPIVAKPLALATSAASSDASTDRDFAFAGAPAEPAQAVVEVEAPEPRRASTAPAALPDDEAKRRALAHATSGIESVRGGPLDDLLATVRRIASEEPSIAAEKLADLAVSTSREMSEYAHDAIRFSIDETRRAGADFDDEAVAVRVEMMLKGVHAPITGTPGISERNAATAAAAMSPTGATGPTPFVWLDPNSLPRRQWLYGTHLIRKEVSATLAPGGVGKTSLGIAEALAVASGKPLLGIPPVHRCKVWLWNGEEPIEELQRRIMAACVHFRLKPSDIDGWLYVDNIDTFEFVVASEAGRGGVHVARPLVNNLVAWIGNSGIDVLFIDPFISTHNVNENDNNAIQKAVTAWKDVAREGNCAVSIAHHTRKLGGQAATAEDSRGAKSFSDKCRVARPINPMSKEEADRFGIPIQERRFYFSIDPTETKANMTAAVGGKDWFRSVPIVLGKGRDGNLDQGDSIGVVERWAPPSPTAEAPDDLQLTALREAMGEKDWRAAKNLFGQADSVGAPIGEAFGLDLSKAADMRRAKALFDKLKVDGIFCEVRVKQADRKERPVVRWTKD